MIRLIFIWFMTGVVLYGAVAVVKLPNSANAAIEVECGFEGEDASLELLHHDAIMASFCLGIFRLPANGKSDSIAVVFVVPEGRFDQPHRGPPRSNS